jgi:hypothetical protein
MLASIAKKNSKNVPMNYIILMTSNMKLLQREPGKQSIAPEIDLYIDFNDLKIEITNKQLQQIITLG